MGFPVEIGDLPLYAGDTFTQSFVIKEDDVPVNLTSWTNWLCQYRVTPDAESAIDLPLDVTNLATGRVAINIPATTVAEISANGVFDIQAKQGDVIRTWIRGYFIWTEDVTRA